MTLYQNKDEFRLCEGKNTLLPIWDPNESYYLHTPKAEKAVKGGLPITLEVRGVIDHTVQEVYISEIHEVIVGTNNQCEREH